MQRGFTEDKGNENTPNKRDNKETKPDTCWILPLLRNNRQLPEYERFPISDNEEPV